MKRLTVAIYVWVLSLLVCAALAAFSFVRLDVPLARHFWNSARFLNPLAEGFGAAVLLTAESLVILTIVVARVVRGHVSAFGKTLAIACLSSICTYVVNDHVLKMLFGVPGPAAIMRGARHSFVFLSGSEHSSFPSGHMALAAGFSGVFMRLYAVSIWPLSALLLLAASLLIVGDWHFLSDIIAGTFFGLSAGLLAGEGAAHSPGVIGYK